jgi:hypothetical protein
VYHEVADYLCEHDFGWQLICGSFLTLLRAYDLAQSKAVRQMLATNNDSSVFSSFTDSFPFGYEFLIVFNQTDSATFPVSSAWCAKQQSSPHFLKLSRFVCAIRKELESATQ